MLAVRPGQLRERASELEQIHGAVDNAVAGRGSVVAIEGAAGLGKTTLIAAARERGEQAGARVLAARGSELERDFAGGVVRQLFEPILYAADEAERGRLFDGAAALARPFFDADLGATPPGREDEVGFRRRHGLYWLVANLARDGPVVVAVDDAQWADEPSVGFVVHLAARLEHLPVLLVVGFRPHVGGVAGLLVQPSARVVRPAPLSPAAVSGWVGDALGPGGDPVFADACHRATGGNPFLVAELLHEVRAQQLAPDATGVERLRALSPRGVAASVLLRLAGLEPAAAALARAASVLGESDLPLLSALADLDLDAAVAAAGALARAGVLEAAEPVRFVHPVVRTVLYEDVPPPERARAHAVAARLLHEAGAGTQRIAAQLVLATPIGERWALEALVAGAEEAMRRGGPEVAARLLGRALEEPGEDHRFAVTLALGRAEVLAGRPGAEDRLRAAVRLARTPGESARATVDLSRLLRYDGAGGEAVDLLQEAAGRLSGQDEHLALLLERELLAAATVSYAARDQLRDRVGRWWRDAERPPRTFFDRFVFAAQAVEAATAGRSAGKVVELADAARAEEPGIDHLARLLVLFAFLLVDRFDRVDRIVRIVTEAATERGGAQTLGVVSAQQAYISVRRGRLAEAEGAAVQALELAAELQSAAAFRATAAAALLNVAAERGEPPHPLVAGITGDGDSLFGLHVDHARSKLDVAHGRLEQGVAGLLAVGERQAAIGWTGPTQFSWRSEAALALAALGERDRAARLADEEVELAQACGAPRATGIALRAAALLAEDQGARLRGLGHAVAVLEGSGAELELARALVDLGAATRRARRPVEARTPLRRGAELATRCGAPPLAERARQELLAAGGRPRRPTLEGRDALTPSERRVVELAARELTNRDIAQTLFVTEKTVETHLGHAYAKLGVNSRRHLARALAAKAA